MVSLGVNTCAQKLKKPTIDKFTGDTTWGTSNENIAQTIHRSSMNQENLYLKGSNTKHTYALYFTIFQYNTSTTIFYIDTGQKAYVRLSDKSSIILTNMSGGHLTDLESHSHYSISGHLTVCFILTKENIEKLKTSKVEIIRFNTSKGTLDFDIKPKSSDVIIKTVELIASVN